MAGEKRPHLRVVGGNDTLVRIKRASRETPWPPLRVVGEERPREMAAPQSASTLRAVQMPKPAAWSQALLAGLVVVMLSSIGQAIAAHW
jgi:hypothetical protein